MGPAAASVMAATVNVASDFDARLALVRALVRSEATHSASVIETHMSWVFLTDRHAYKLKKPVRYDYLDLGSPDARRKNCEEEVRLNRRLAPDVYLGVVALTMDDACTMRVDGEGEVIDWLVKMRRLPADRMLDRAIASATVNEGEVRRLAARLSSFYSACGPAESDPANFRQRFVSGMEENRRELTRAEYALPVELVDRVCMSQRQFLERHREILDQRVHAGHVVEGHGDLRPEHICLQADISIIDCLEFSREHRLLDAADELGFLALECERLGAAWIKNVLFVAYRSDTGDWPDAALVDFYQSYRACVRARLAILHLREVRFRQSPKWTQRALHYLRLAQAHEQGYRSTP